MVRHPIRETVITTLRQIFSSRSSELTEPELRAPALIIAPHYDDETIGCGGTIGLKVAAGSTVHVVFMTDGTRSHSHLMNPRELGLLRKAEGIEACAEFGVAHQSITHLGIPETEIELNLREAVDRLGEIMSSARPAQIFCPYRADGNPDHEATHRATVAAIYERQIGARLFEYPIWVWHVWPWCRVQLKGRSYIPNHAGLAFSRNFFLIKRINRVANLGTAAIVKKRALNCHRSQMVRQVDDRRWLTLFDVAQGDFLKSCLGNEEWFVCS